jgi:Tfp pilus assembly protein PilN
MIKVNLLDSVTERPRGPSAVEQKVASPTTNTMVQAIAVSALVLIAILLELYSSSAENRKWQKELDNQKRIAAQMEAVRKEQSELEKKIKEIQSRTEAIQKLRSSQRGPVAVLSAVNERLPNVPEFRLESLEQKGKELIIKGNSPNETAVTQFGSSLEFSSGLFTNVSIETVRKVIEGAAPAPTAPGEEPAPRPETIGFTIKCNYTPPAPLPVQSSQESQKAKANS